MVKTVANEKVKTAVNETRYRIYKNKLHHILKIAEKQHYSELLINCQLWRKHMEKH